MSHLRRALYVVGPERAARLTGHEHLHLKRLLWSWHSSVEIEFRVSADLSSELLNTDEEQGRASAAESPSPTGDRYLIVFVEETLEAGGLKAPPRPSPGRGLTCGGGTR